jgi:hypothetical protein
MPRSQADLNKRAAERRAAASKVDHQSLVDRAYGFVGRAKRALSQFNVPGTAASRMGEAATTRRKPNYGKKK